MVRRCGSGFRLAVLPLMAMFTPLVLLVAAASAASPAEAVATGVTVILSAIEDGRNGEIWGGVFWQEGWEGREWAGKGYSLQGGERSMYLMGQKNAGGDYRVCTCLRPMSGVVEYDGNDDNSFGSGTINRCLV